MRQLTIGTKTQADKILVDSLFHPVNGRTLSVMKYSAGKYRAESSYIGRVVEVSDDVHALYVVKGRDSDGAFVRVMCVTE